MFWILTPYQKYDLQIFSSFPWGGGHFTLLTEFFDAQKFYIFMKSNLSSFFFY